MIFFFFSRPPLDPDFSVLLSLTVGEGGRGGGGVWVREDVKVFMR